MTKHFYVMWNDSGKPYEFIYDTYGKANQMAHDLIRSNFEPMIVIRFDGYKENIKNKSC
jgi:hypothetical protein